MDKLFVGVCTYLKLDSQSVYKQARVVIGSISLKPIQATGIEDGIIGKKLTDDLIDKAVDGYELSDTDFTFDIRCPVEYKKWAIPVIIKRALKLALSRVS